MIRKTSRAFQYSYAYIKSNGEATQCCTLCTACACATDTALPLCYGIGVDRVPRIFPLVSSSSSFFFFFFTRFHSFSCVVEIYEHLCDRICDNIVLYCDLWALQNRKYWYWGRCTWVCVCVDPWQRMRQQTTQCRRNQWMNEFYRIIVYVRHNIPSTKPPSKHPNSIRQQRKGVAKRSKARETTTGTAATVTA